jgi:hypothetical protein
MRRRCQHTTPHTHLVRSPAECTSSIEIRAGPLSLSLRRRITTASWGNQGLNEILGKKKHLVWWGLLHIRGAAVPQVSQVEIKSRC